jgi:hypothetical protein
MGPARSQMETISWKCGIPIAPGAIDLRRECEPYRVPGPKQRPLAEIAQPRFFKVVSNRELSCGASRPAVHDTPGLPDPPAISGVLQMRDEMSGMS